MTKKSPAMRKREAALEAANKSDMSMKVGGFHGSEQASSNSTRDMNTLQVENKTKKILKNCVDDEQKMTFLRNFIEKTNIKKELTVILGSNPSPAALYSSITNDLTIEEKNRLTRELGIDTRTETLGNGKVITFHTELVKPEDIETKTRLSKFNPRGYSASSMKDISEVEVLDIMQTIEKRQDQVAIGRRAEDGVIEVIDGSRRRLGCLKRDVIFAIEVTEDYLDAVDVNYLFESKDQVEKSKREFNPVEKGNIFKEFLAAGGTIEEITKIYSIQERQISKCIKAFEVIPEKLLTLVYSRSKLGMRLLEDLIVISGVLNSLDEDSKSKLYDLLDDNFTKMSQLEEYSDDLVIDAEPHKQIGIINKFNKKFVDSMMSIVSKDGFLEADSSIGSKSFKNVFKKRVGRVNQKLDVKNTGGGKTTTLKLTHFTEDDIASIIELIRLNQESPDRILELKSEMIEGSQDDAQEGTIKADSAANEPLEKQEA